MPKNWKMAEKVPQEVREKLSNHTELAAQLLYNRAIVEPNDAENFLNVKYEDLHSPFLFQDMQKAVDRIWQAIEQNEKICVYGDYDADAVTANAVLQQTFKYLGVEVQSYIPNRFSEGYGVNLDALQKIRSDGSRIIITVDCGTNSTDAAEFCKENELDFIITDHHEIIGEVPDAYALINPKNPNDNYPYQEITGVGVAFKLACGILADSDRINKFLSFRASQSASEDESRNLLIDKDNISLHSSAALVGPDGVTCIKKHIPGFEKWLLDLVAIGTVADCHSLMGENRILVKFGLKVLIKTRWIGLRALMGEAGLTKGSPLQQKGNLGLQKSVDTYTLGFVIAPRLNAAGRLEHADIALHLLMEEDLQEAQKKAQALEEINRRRQDQTARMMSEAREQAELIKERKILVIAQEGWSKGVVGLVAGRLVEEFNRPVIVLEKGLEESTGSARTVGEFNVVEALKYSSEHLVRFGGHKQAAGLTLKTEHFEIFYQKILEFAESNLSDADVNRSLTLEAVLDEGELSIVNCQLLNQFEPFGVDNQRPKFLVKNAKVLSTKCVGAKEQHLQIRLQIGSKEISGIYFNCADFAKSLKFGDNIDIAAEIMEDEWQGRRTAKLRIIDMKYGKI